MQPIRFLLAQLGVEHEEKLYEQGDETTQFSIAEWATDRDSLGLDFPNTPYLIYGDLKLTHPLSIMKFITLKYGQNTMVSEFSDEQKGEVEMLAHTLYDLLQKSNIKCYIPKIDQA